MAQSEEDNVKLSKYITDRILVNFFQWVSFSQNFHKKGLVRTVEIAYRRRNKSEPVHSYKIKPLVKETVHVQKLSLLQPVNEPTWDNDIG